MTRLQQLPAGVPADPADPSGIATECYELALRWAVRNTRQRSRGEDWALAPDQPFWLALLRDPQTTVVPRWDDSGSLDEFIGTVVAWANQHLLAVYHDGPDDFVPPSAGIALSVIWCLKARTAVRLRQDLCVAIQTLARQLGQEPPSMRQLLTAGDTRSFGAMPLEWIGPWGQSFGFIGAGTGGHPLADRYAVQQILPELDLAARRYGYWGPLVVASDTFVLSEPPTAFRYP